jgi:hypothetical protein
MNQTSAPAAGGGLGGEDLLDGFAVFEQGDLPAESLVVDGDGLVGVADLGGLPAAGQGAHGQGGGFAAAVGDGSTSASRQAVNAGVGAAVEPEHDLSWCRR